jgi:hypothetical protein
MDKSKQGQTFAAVSNHFYYQQRGRWLFKPSWITAEQNEEYDIHQCNQGIKSHELPRRIDIAYEG